jgi:hypothetical protein
MIVFNYNKPSKFQIINRLQRLNPFDKEVIETTECMVVWETSLTKCTLDSEVVGKVLSELKKLKWEWLWLDSTAKIFNHPNLKLVP